MQGDDQVSNSEGLLIAGITKKIEQKETEPREGASVSSVIPLNITVQSR